VRYLSYVINRVTVAGSVYLVVLALLPLILVGGALIGIAGGIKLTPLAFGLILLLRKDWRGVASVAGGFVGTIALGFLAVPGEAAYYWGVAVRNTSRIGVTAFYDNVSLTGIFAHQGVPEPIATVLVVAGYSGVWSGDGDCDGRCDMRNLNSNFLVGIEYRRPWHNFQPFSWNCRGTLLETATPPLALPRPAYPTIPLTAKDPHGLGH